MFKYNNQPGPNIAKEIRDKMPEEFHCAGCHLDFDEWPTAAVIHRDFTGQPIGEILWHCWRCAIFGPLHTATGTVQEGPVKLCRDD